MEVVVENVAEKATKEVMGIAWRSCAADRAGQVTFGEGGTSSGQDEEGLAVGGGEGASGEGTEEGQ